MDTKLTLKLNKEVIEKAKKYASKKKVSLSRIIEAYLQALTSEKKQKNSIEISPFVKSMATGTSLPVDKNFKKEYTESLLKKHQ